MPNRIVREGILDSAAVDKLSWQAEVFYRRLMSILDDFGRCDGRMDLIRSKLFPVRVERVSMSDILSWMKECVNAGLISEYEVENKPYVELHNFNQSLRKMKSSFPNKDGRFETKEEYLARKNASESNCMQTSPESNRIESKQNMNEERQSMSDEYLKNLPGSSEFERIAMMLRVPKEELLKYIPDFADARNLSYASFMEFANHFKNWYLKKANKIKETPVKKRNQF